MLAEVVLDIIGVVVLLKGFKDASNLSVAKKVKSYDRWIYF